MKATLLAMIFTLCAFLTGETTPQERSASFLQHLKMHRESLFRNLHWREIGPYFQGGRLVDIEARNDDPFTIFIASASGGLWKTENNGTSWAPLFDGESSITIGDIALSQTDKNLIWVGTGEANSLRSSYAGTGIFKSTDGGRSWQCMGLEDTHHISRILIDPKDNQTVYVAAIGHLYTENEERGLFKSTDGGLNWEKILYISPKTGIIDLVMHPMDHHTLYAAAWERDRKAWNMVESGAESAIYKSIDAGKTWNVLEGGLPKGPQVGRIGLAVTPAAPDALFAFIDNQEPRKPGRENTAGDANTALFRTNIKGAEVYRSTDRGNSWEKTHKDFLQNQIVNTYGYFFGQIRVSPADPDTLYLLGVPAMKSTDGGKSFREIPPDGGSYGKGGDDVHPDHHALWIDPSNPRHLLLGNDGGLNISYDEGESFQKINNIPLAQCYTIQFDSDTPYNVYTGLQDNGVNMGPSTFKKGDVENAWRMILGGDGAFIQPMPGDGDLVYAAFQFGNLFRLNRKKPNWSKSMAPASTDKENPYRLNWLTPFFASPHDPFTLFLGANKVLKLTAPEDEWREISPDLTDQKHTDGDVPFATITALDQSPLTPRILYAGTDDGNVWTTRDGGKKWEKICDGLPKKWVTRISASRYQQDRVYLGMTGYREDDFSMYLFVSQDGGKTWKSIRANLPDEPVNVIREDPFNENILYLGTDLTVYISLDRGASWHSLRAGLPTNAVYDLRVHPREKELIIGTHGRGVFILPVDKIEQLSGETLKKPVHLFPPEISESPRSYYRLPSLNIVFEFFVREKTGITAEVKNSRNETVKKWAQPAEGGFNRIEWDGKTDTQPGKPVDPGGYTFVIKAGKYSASAAFLVK